MLDTRMQIGLNIDRQESDSVIENVKGLVNFYPRDTPGQVILDKTWTPKYEDTTKGLQFEWPTPKKDILNIVMESRIKIENKPPRILKQVQFPLTRIPQNIKIYTKEAEIIDINDDIIQLASSLAEGEDDLAIVVDNIAAWVTQNIEYNLSTVTADASLKSSWVLENREGVCDELTALFISMLRSLNVPARFVAGISYTNSPLFDVKWGPHGWAEVYFPNYGWIPYDVTYGEYGYVDPTHIIAKYSRDAGKITTKFSWRSHNTDVTVRPLTTDIKIKEYGEKLVPRVKIDVELLKGSVGFGSHNLVEATVQNLANYYQPIDIYMAKTSQMTSLDPIKRHILLKPEEKRKIFWKVKVDSDLKKDFLYTFPILVYMQGDVRDKAEFKSIAGGVRLSEQKVEDELRERQEGRTKALDRSLIITCDTDKDDYYPDEKPKVSCVFKNTGNTLLEGIQMCIDDDCQSQDIGITQSKEIELEYTIQPGVNDLIITAIGGGIEEQRVIDVQVKDLPVLEITKLKHPQEADYDDAFHIFFTIRKTSIDSPQQVITTMKLKNEEVPFTLDILEGERTYDITTAGNTLHDMQNEFVVTTTWKDGLGREYETTQTFTINLKKPTFSQKIRIWLDGIGRWVGGLFS